MARILKWAIGYYIAGVVTSWVLVTLAQYGMCWPALARIGSWFFEPVFVAVFGVW